MPEEWRKRTARRALQCGESGNKAESPTHAWPYIISWSLRVSIVSITNLPPNIHACLFLRKFNTSVFLQTYYFGWLKGGFLHFRPCHSDRLQWNFSIERSDSIHRKANARKSGVTSKMTLHIICLYGGGQFFVGEGLLYSGTEIKLSASWMLWGTVIEQHPRHAFSCTSHWQNWSNWQFQDVKIFGKLIRMTVVFLLNFKDLF